MSAPDRGTRSARPPRLADVITRAVTGCLGAGMMLLPAPQLTGRSWALVPIGLVLVVVSLAGPLARWRIVGTLAAATAVIESALTRPDLAMLAWEGLLILGYLLLVDAPRAMPGPVTARWLWRQLPLAVWGVFSRGRRAGRARRPRAGLRLATRRRGRCRRRRRRHRPAAAPGPAQGAQVGRAP